MALILGTQADRQSHGVDFQDALFYTSGTWLIAIVTWRYLVPSPLPVINIADAPRNVWTLLATKTATASNTQAYAGTVGTLNVQVWACPGVLFDGWPYEYVTASIQSCLGTDQGSFNVKYIEWFGFGNNYLTVDSITLNQAANSNSLTLTPPAPTGGANCLFIAAAEANIAYGSYTTTGTGWTQLANNTLTSPDSGLVSAYAESTTANPVTFNFAVGSNPWWAGVVVAIRTTGVVPSQPNPNWPAVSLQIGYGYDLSTPPSAVWWTDQSNRYWGLQTRRGIQYELGNPQAEPTTVVIRNNDGVVTPKTTWQGATISATGSGTTTTFVCSATSATQLAVNYLFRLNTEKTIFIVTAVSTTGGTSTITFTAADGSGAALAATTISSVMTGISVDIYTPVQILMAWGGKWHYVARGWFERWPLKWRDPNWGTAGAITTSALAQLTAANPTCLAGEIMRRQPQSYWPCSDPAGSSTASNVSGVGLAQLIQTVTTSGAATNQTVDFGGSTQGTDNDPNKLATVPNITTLIGDPGTCWHQAFQSTGGSTALNNGQGYALVAKDSSFPSIANGVTIFFCATYTVTDQSVVNASTTSPTLMIIRCTDPQAGVGQGSVIKVSYKQANNGLLTVTVWDKTTHATTVTTCAAVGSITQRWASFALTFNQTSWVMYADGQVAASGSCNLVSSFSIIDFFGESDQFFSGNTMLGELAHCAIFPRVLSAMEVYSLDNAARSGYGNDLEWTGNRWQRKLDTVGMKTGRVIDVAGNVFCDGEGTDASTIADLGNQLAGYDDSYLFEDAAGAVQIRPPGRYVYQNSRATVGENVPGGELPYLGDQTEVDYDPTYLYNAIKVTNTIFNQFAYVQNIAVSTFVALNSTTASKYNLRTVTRDSRISGDKLEYVFYLAYWLLSQYQSPRMRFQTVTLNPAANTGLWQFCLTVEVGDLITVYRRALGGSPIAITCVVMQVEHAGAPSQFTTKLTLAPARSYGLLTNDSVRGIVGNNYLTME